MERQGIKKSVKKSLSRVVGGQRETYGTLEDNDATDSKKKADRVIYFNQQQPHKFCKNKISTAKYNFVTFLPKFLLEQFSRYANVFFLLIALLQQIPNVSPTGRYTTAIPLLFVLSCSAIKEIIEDLKRHRADDQTNNRMVKVLRDGIIMDVEWTQVVVGDIVKVLNGNFFPADLIILSSSEPMGMCYIETANLDGETNLKIRTALPLTSDCTTVEHASDLKGRLECEGPNNRLYEFVGNIVLQGNKAVPLSGDQVLLRGAQLRNTPWIFGIVVYTGHESKLLQNATAAPIKRSNVDRMTNIQILFLFALLIVLALLSSIGYQVWINKHEDWYLGFETMEPQNFGKSFLTFFILYNNLIPISLPVTLEIVKFIQALLINADRDIYYEKNDTPAMARTSNLNEELGQVKYIFSDKTGTLTCNIMQLKKMSIAGVTYGIDDEYNMMRIKEDLESGVTSEYLMEFFTLLSVCHTVVPEREPERPEKIIYQAASPDEGALVEGAAQLDFVFNTRTPTSVIINHNGEDQVYEILNVLEFTSTRKRMSVVVRTPDDKIKVFCKGADTVIYERLADDQKFMDVTLTHLEEFAREGLRTLCIAAAVIDADVYLEWSQRHYEASTSLKDRELKLEQAAEMIEKDLVLLGATAIEDKLQDGVPESIAALSAGNIKIWVLTGDKQETAINIGYSCRLLRDSLTLLICKGETVNEVKTWLKDQISHYNIEIFEKKKKKDKREVAETKNLAFIVTGSVLRHCLGEECKELFLDLTLICRAVIACRVSPLQKSLVVQLVKNNVKDAITLAIGDGANDVSMIQAAHIGIGISGQEGLQAASASDYAIAQFRFLNKLLFVHGAFSYSRLTKLILYSFYKNICLYVIELWFAFSNGFSGQILFDKWCIGLYNVIFTFLPPLAFGLFDRTCTAEARLNCPRLYKNSQNSDLFNVKVFWIWVLTAIFHSLLLFYFPKWIFATDMAFSDGTVVGQWFVGNVVYTCVVITVCLKAAIELDTWTIYSHLAIWGSMAAWFIFLFIYCSSTIARLFAPNMLAQDIMLYSSPLFWMTLLILPVLTLLADFLFHIFQRTFKKNTRQIVQELELSGLDPSEWILDERGVPMHQSPDRMEMKNSHGSIRSDHGYAFSQEENGLVTQSDVIRRYDTNLAKPLGE